MLEKLPEKEGWHEYRYKQLLRKYGINQTGVATVNTIFLAELNVVDTPENRDVLRQRMTNAKQEIRDDSEIFRGEAKQEKDTLSLKVEALIDTLEKSDYPEFINPRDIATLYRIRLDLAIHEAKLFGLYQEGKNEPSKDTDKTPDRTGTDGTGKSEFEREAELVRRWSGRKKDDGDTPPKDTSASDA